MNKFLTALADLALVAALSGSSPGGAATNQPDDKAPSGARLQVEINECGVATIRLPAAADPHLQQLRDGRKITVQSDCPTPIDDKDISNGSGP